MLKWQFSLSGAHRRSHRVPGHGMNFAGDTEPGRMQINHLEKSHARSQCLGAPQVSGHVLVTETEPRFPPELFQRSHGIPALGL